MKTSNILLVLAALIFMSFNFYNIKNKPRSTNGLLGNEVIETRDYIDFSITTFLLGYRQDLSLDPSFSGLSLTTDENILDAIEKIGIQEFFSPDSINTDILYRVIDNRHSQMKHSNWMNIILGTKDLKTLNIKSNTWVKQDRPSKISTVDTVHFDYIYLSSSNQILTDCVIDAKTLVYHTVTGSKANKIAGKVNNMDIWANGSSNIDATNLEVKNNISLKANNQDTFAINTQNVTGIIEAGGVVDNHTKAKQNSINIIYGKYTEPE